MNEPEKLELLQWHPAFYAGLQIEFEEEKDDLAFDNEYQLGTKPKEIDVLIVKKKAEPPIRKNIGRIFRKYNIVEYKSPLDFLSIDDFYTTYGYACFYKADTGAADAVKIDDITITFACSRYPRKLMKHLKEHGYKITIIEDGIFYISDSRIPIQLLLIPKLSKKENLWLHSLTNAIKKTEQIDQLIAEYGHKKDNPLYQSMMDIIVRANKNRFQEVKDMCQALEELMKDELDAKRREGEREGELMGKIKGIKALIETCKEVGMDRKSTFEKVVEKFKSQQADAEIYMNQFWK